MLALKQIVHKIKLPMEAADHALLPLLDFVMAPRTDRLISRDGITNRHLFYFESKILTWIFFLRETHWSVCSSQYATLL